MEFLKPTQISVSKILEYFNKDVHSNNFIIPNICVPIEMISKNNNDPLILEIRLLYNRLSDENLEEIIKSLRELMSKIKNYDMFEKIVDEIFFRFIKSEDNNIQNYYYLLNSISSYCISLEDNKISKSLGNIFLSKLNKNIFNYISKENILKIASYNKDNDENENDNYIKDKNKIFCLVKTICILYKQRNTPNLKLSNIHISGLLNEIFNLYDLCFKEINSATSKSITKNMTYIYAEILYTFILLIGNELKNEINLLNNIPMNSFNEKFKNEILTKIDNEFLLVKFKNIENILNN